MLPSPVEPSQSSSGGADGSGGSGGNGGVGVSAPLPGPMSQPFRLGRLPFSQVAGSQQQQQQQINMMTASQDLNVALSGCSLNSQQPAPARPAPPPPPKWGETPPPPPQQSSKQAQLQVQQQRIAPPLSPAAAAAPPLYDEPNDLPLSQLAPQSQIDAYILGSQDFVTPADQAMENQNANPFGNGGNGNVLTGSRHARSPAAAAPSPLRGFAKRARGSRLAVAAGGGGAGGGVASTPGGGDNGAAGNVTGPRSNGSGNGNGNQQQQAAAAGLLPALLRGHHRRARSPPVATNVFMQSPRGQQQQERPGSSSSSSSGRGGGGGGGAKTSTNAPPPPSTSSAPFLPSPQSMPVVSRYAAEFRELGPLGSGAFSRVVRAAHRLDGREYAIKKSTAELFSAADVARWRQEAQALAAAGTHRAIVRYYGAWAERGPRGGLLMHLQLERCGASLAARAAVIGGGGGGGGFGRGGSGGGSRRGGVGVGVGSASSNSNHHALTPLREDELVSAGAQIASALAHLHARGIAHMDVKPDNIFCALAADGCSVETVGGSGGGGGGRKGKGGGSVDGGVGGGDGEYLADEDDEDDDCGPRDPDGLDELEGDARRGCGGSSSFVGGGGSATVAVKLGDFGLATPIRRSSASSSSAAVALAPDEGDCRYLAPELLDPPSTSKGNSANARTTTIDLAAADAFALGASLYELASGAPLPSGGPLWRNLREGRLALLPAASAPFQRLLRALMSPDPRQRPTMEEALRSGPFATAIERIEGGRALRRRGGGGGSVVSATAAAPSTTTSSLMPPPPPRAPPASSAGAAAAAATANKAGNSNSSSRFGTLCFKPTAAATAAAAAAPR